MIEPSQELWAFVNNWSVVLVAGRSNPKSSCNGTDQIEVADPTRLPSFFQSSHQLPCVVPEHVRVDAAAERASAHDGRRSPGKTVLAHNRSRRRLIGTERPARRGRRRGGNTDALVAGGLVFGGRVEHDEVVVGAVVGDARRPRVAGLGPCTDVGECVRAQLGPGHPVRRRGLLDVDRLGRLRRVLRGKGVVRAVVVEDARVREVAWRHGCPVPRHCGCGVGDGEPQRAECRKQHGGHHDEDASEGTEPCPAESGPALAEHRAARPMTPFRYRLFGRHSVLSAGVAWYLLIPRTATLPSGQRRRGRTPYPFGQAGEGN